MGGLRRWLPAPVIGVLTFAIMFAALMFWSLPLLLPLALIKVLVPVPALQRLCDDALSWIAGVGWVGTNQRIFALLHGPRRNVVIDGKIDPAHSALIVANHQSWADILILFDVFYQRAPFPRFFLKRELIWIPLVGFICYALDMPFMKRNTGGARRRDEDLETTRRFCAKYRARPITVVTFAEGTRSSAAKRLAKDSPYRHLLRPKSAGLSFTLNAMGEQFNGLLDTTLIYSRRHRGRSKLWSFLCGEQSGAQVLVRLRPLPAELLAGDYQNDAAFRARFQHWLNALWADKDAAIDAALAARAHR